MLSSELHGTQQDQRGPVESELNEYGHNGRVLAPVIGRYGGASSDLSPILDLVARELARKHAAFYNIGFSEAKAMFKQKLARKWGHAIARGGGALLLGRLRDFIVNPSSVGGNSSSLHDSQGADELATLDRYYAIAPSIATLACVPGWSFLLVPAALNFLSACWPSNFGPSGPEPKLSTKRSV